MAGSISETAMGGAGSGDLIFHSPCGKKKALDVGGPSSIVNIFGSRIRSSETAMGGGVRSAPFGVLMSPKRRVRAAHRRAPTAKTH
jgi:hypothetical protein